MSLMSIIGCEIFAKEISQLLGKDRDIECLIVINEKKSDVAKEFDELGTAYQKLSPDMLPLGLKQKKGFNVIVDLQSVSLHNDQSKVKKETYEKIKFYGKVSSGVLLLYDIGNDTFADVYSDFKRSRFHMMTLGDTAGKNSEKVEGIGFCIGNRTGGEIPDPLILEAYESSYVQLKEKLVI
ncbi:hypothetical protein [Methanolobus halotolerans]|uniref:DUF1638 domain-containing protein n=1 Tax=Methanolobus halotolerans TaxID=2052935 RepID=A0A4E0QXX4_9EURY|nr:hypothetical protein [Methanolobus halotolerans]TGC08338.1 hypothetical protein CUN85_09690 [Methanolobus halotolerans]